MSRKPTRLERSQSCGRAAGTLPASSLPHPPGYLPSGGSRRKRGGCAIGTETQKLQRHRIGPDGWLPPQSPAWWPVGKSTHSERLVVFGPTVQLRRILVIGCTGYPLELSCHWSPLRDSHPGKGCLWPGMVFPGARGEQAFLFSRDCGHSSMTDHRLPDSE